MDELNIHVPDSPGEVIGDAGRLLFGVYWQAPLARLMGVGERVVRHWLNGEKRPSDHELRKLTEVMFLQSVHLRSFSRKLERRLDTRARRFN